MILFLFCFFFGTARNWDAEAAEKMLRDVSWFGEVAKSKFVGTFRIHFQSMKWRERWDLDGISNWKAPTPLIDYCPYGLSGFDKEGSPSE